MYIFWMEIWSGVKVYAEASGVFSEAAIHMPISNFLSAFRHAMY